MFVVGAIVVTLTGYAALWATAPSLNLLLCESREYDSSYGQASLRLPLPAVRCDFSEDLYFSEQGVEDRGTWLLVLAPVIFVAGSGAIGVCVARRQTRGRPPASA